MKKANHVVWQMTRDELTYMRAVALAASPHIDRPVLTNIAITAKGQTVSATCTDSYRVHRVTWTRSDISDELGDTLIPAKWFLRYAPRRLAMSETLDLHIGDELSISDGRETHAIRRLRWEWPNVDAIINGSDQPVIAEDAPIGVNPTFLADVARAAEMLRPLNGSGLAARKVDLLKPMRFQIAGEPRFDALVMPVRLMLSADQYFEAA